MECINTINIGDNGLNLLPPLVNSYCCLSLYDPANRRHWANDVGPASCLPGSEGARSACFYVKLRGLVKLKKYKNPRKTRIGRNPKSNIFLTHVEQKNTKLPKKNKSELGLDPHTLFPVFLGFFYFFQLTKIPLLLRCVLSILEDA